MHVAWTTLKRTRYASVTSKYRPVKRTGVRGLSPANHGYKADLDMAYIGPLKNGSKRVSPYGPVDRTDLVRRIRTGPRTLKNKNKKITKN